MVRINKEFPISATQGMSNLPMIEKAKGVAKKSIVMFLRQRRTFG
jgi:hypothetical protein